LHTHGVNEAMTAVCSRVGAFFGAVRPIPTSLRSAQLEQGSAVFRPYEIATQPGRLSGGACRSFGQRGGGLRRSGCAVRRGRRRTSVATSSAEI
jgi:hypothetical protein